MFLFALGLLIGLATGLLARSLAFREHARLHPPTATLTVSASSAWARPTEPWPPPPPAGNRHPRHVSTRYEDRQ